MDIHDTVIIAKDHLQQCYINSRYSPVVDEWPPYQPRHYTTLALIHHKDKYTDAAVITVELAVSGKIQKRTQKSNTCTTKDISDIFMSVTASDMHTINSCIILIEGAPGIGKTVLAKEIAFQWAGKNLLPNIKFLFLIFLRECDLKKMTSVESFVQCVVKSSDMAAGLAKYLFQTQGKDLAIVFDGYDEISEVDRKRSIIADIIYRKIFAKCCIVITSRPTASSNLHNIVDCRVEIVGFTKEDRFDYIQTALQNDDDKIKALTLYLQSNLTINALCYIPLNMTILLCLVEDGIDRLPKSQTDMYKRFIEMTIIRFTQKTNIKVSTANTSIVKLPYPHNKIFEELAQLAFKALEMDKIVFTLNEIEDACPNLTLTSSNWDGLGLLKAVKYFNSEVGKDLVTFHFLHFSIQEYMAAWYISTLSDDQQIKLLKNTFWKHRHYNTWIMYVGITSASSFALKHFLSGNWFQLSTKIFKTSSICNEFLKDKIKCLHLFQCLVESNNEDMVALVSRYFWGDRIDLSSQTLLPGDVNTLAFFLVRSITKQWQLLDLSDCNIGITSIDILCNCFLDKGNRHIITIRKVNFSHNQLNFSYLIQLFELFKSWDTSEIIIADNGMIQSNPSYNELYDAVENAFNFCEHHTQVKLKFESFYFAHGINMVGSTYDFGEIHCKNVFLLNCKWIILDYASVIKECNKIFENQKFKSVHLINSVVPDYFVKEICIALNDSVQETDINNNEVNSIFVYKCVLSDEDDNKMHHLVSSKMIHGVMLVISEYEVQGIINVVTLSNILSTLELLNLIANVRIMCCEDVQMIPWRQDLCCNGSKSDLIIHTFIELIYKFACTRSAYYFKIALREKDTLIAHKVDYNVLKKVTAHEPTRTAVYLSDCDISSEEYVALCHQATKIYIYNGHVDKKFFEILLSANSLFKEVFVHNLHDIEAPILMPGDLKLKCSILFVTKRMLFGYEPTTEQVMLALQLEPSVDALKLYNCQGNINIFNKIMTVLTTTPDDWSELDFVNCGIGDLECDILYRQLKNKKKFSTVKTLKISIEKLKISILPKLVKIILMWKVQDLIFCGIDHVIYKNFIKSICTSDNKSFGEISLSVTYNNKIISIFCNFNWMKITNILKVATMYFDTYYLCSRTIENIIQLDDIVQIYIINSFSDNSTLQSQNFCISCNTHLEELDSGDYNLQTAGVVVTSRALQSISTLKRWYISKNNVTEEAAEDIAAVISCNTQLQEFDVSNNNLQAAGVITISKALQSITTLTKLYISKNNITDKAAVYIATAITCNTQLQEFDVSNNDLQASGAITIAKSLQSISTLVKLYISKNNITDEAADDIAAAITCNTQLQELNVSDNDLQASGAITIAKAVQGISALVKLYISKNNITDEAADDIAAAITCNTQLQELDISDNDLQASGAIEISKALQSISTLVKLYISKNGITEKAADDIAAAISYNKQIYELDIGDNDLQTLGTIKISKGLQGISTLTKLCFSKNNITNNTADDIAAAISCNSQLKEFDISNNNLQESGAVTISKALRNISTLTKFYISNNNITDKATDDVAIAISSNTRLQELDISNNDLQTAGATMISKALQSISTLTKFYISNNNITPKGADNIATAISCNAQLKELDIGDNNLQPTGAITVLRALKGISTLTKLYIKNNNITDKTAHDFAAVISCNTKLKELDISSNYLQTIGTIIISKALKGICTLTKLYISNNTITDKAADDIAAAISCNTQLKELDISNNNFQTEGLLKISKALQGIFTLTTLDISKNNITDTAADELAAAIFCNAQLQKLDISDNNLQAMDVITISKALHCISTLTKLCISENNITDEAADDIAGAILCNTQLQELDISDNDLRASGAVKISNCLQKISSLTKLYIGKNNITDKAALDIAAAISYNTHLQELDISENYLQASGVMIISEVLQGIYTLTKLYISKNSITKKGACYISAIISCNIQLQVLDVSDNDLQATGAKIISKALQGISTLRILYISKNNITYKAANGIAAVISCNTQLQQLDISDNDLQAAGVTIISKALQGISTLTKLCISKNNITAKGADDIAVVISSNTELRELDIANNDLKAAGVIIISRALQSTSALTKLHVSKNNITDEAANDIATAISCSTQLQEFDISDNNLQVTGTIAISRALQAITTLRKLHISENNIPYKAIDSIATAISCNAQLEELNVSSNELQASGAAKILKALQSISGLTKLYISNNNITDKAANDIATVISCNAQIQELDISANNLQASGTIIIFKALQSISTLTKLYISKNNITDKAADDIATVITCNTQLKVLDIGNNDLQSSGTIVISKALQGISGLIKFYISNNNVTDKAARDIATAIYCNAQLQEFDISDNDLQTIGTIKVAKALQCVSTLTKLYITKNNITDRAANDIAAVCSCNTQLQEFHFGNNDFTALVTFKLYICCKNSNMKTITEH